jgi:sugar lactone lactonase YvrE
MTVVSVSMLVNAAAQVGEGPVWLEAAERLLWVDIPLGQIHSSTLDGATTTVQTPTMIGAVAPRRAGGLVAAVREGIAIIGADGRFENRLPMLAGGHRMNDAKCDSRGRLWAGSTDMAFAAGMGALHVIFPDWSTRTVLEGLTLPNGLGWSPDDRAFYLADTMEGVIWAFEFDPVAATLSGRRELHRFDSGRGMPDGLCVDASGRLWVAMWGGDRVMVLSPSGEVTDEIALPVHQPSSCTFVGKDLDRLCVTSAREGLGLPDDDPAPDGSVLCLDGTGARGMSTAAFGG